MKQTPQAPPSSPAYVSNRILKINVGFLLNDGPAHNHDSQIDFPAVRVSDDLTLKYVRGPLRLSRTKEGVLVQATLESAVESECYRCLDLVENSFEVTIEELYATQPALLTEFRVNEDGILDLAPLLREEALIALAGRTLCRPDCKGLCPECGANLNDEPHHSHDDDIDPRMAALKKLLETK